MNKTILLFFLLISTNIFSQKIDSTQIYFPYTVGRQVLLDLNEFDRTKELLNSSKNEIIELEKKVLKQGNEIKSLELIDSTSQILIIKSDEKFKIVEKENKKLNDDMGKLKTKNTIIEVISGALVVAITYLSIFK
jgi:hypothetical protein